MIPDRFYGEFQVLQRSKAPINSFEKPEPVKIPNMSIDSLFPSRNDHRSRLFTSPCANRKSKDVAANPVIAVYYPPIAPKATTPHVNDLGVLFLFTFLRIVAIALSRAVHALHNKQHVVPRFLSFGVHRYTLIWILTLLVYSQGWLPYLLGSS